MLEMTGVYNKDGAKRHHNFRHFSAIQAFYGLVIKAKHAIKNILRFKTAPDNTDGPDSFMPGPGCHPGG